MSITACRRSTEIFKLLRLEISTGSFIPTVVFSHYSPAFRAFCSEFNDKLLALAPAEQVIRLGQQ